MTYSELNSITLQKHATHTTTITKQSVLFPPKHIFTDVYIILTFLSITTLRIKALVLTFTPATFCSRDCVQQVILHLHLLFNEARQRLTVLLFKG